MASLVVKLAVVLAAVQLVPPVPRELRAHLWRAGGRIHFRIEPHLNAGDGRSGGSGEAATTLIAVLKAETNFEIGQLQSTTL